MSEYEEITLTDILRFLRKYRTVILLILAVSLIVIFIITNINRRLDERAVQAARAEAHAEANASFSSSNLERVEPGLYRIRVETFGDRADPRRDDTYVDFDRDLSITVTREHGVLALRVENLNEEIVLDRIRLRGSLRNREASDFNLIDTTHYRLNLGFNEVSRGVPLIVFAGDNRAEGTSNWRSLTNLVEFREYFELDFLKVSFDFLEEDEGVSRRVTLRYISRFDRYDVYEVEEEMSEENGEQ